jgi:hypothetical protein
MGETTTDKLSLEQVEAARLQPDTLRRMRDALLARRNRTRSI